MLVTLIGVNCNRMPFFRLNCKFVKCSYVKNVLFGQTFFVFQSVNDLVFCSLFYAVEYGIIYDLILDV